MVVKHRNRRKTPKNNEAREARSAEPFFMVSKERKPLHIGSHTRIGCLELLSLFVYVSICFGPVCTPHSTYMAPKSRWVLCTHKWQPTLLELVSLKVVESSSSQVRQRVFSPAPKLGSYTCFASFQNIVIKRHFVFLKNQFHRANPVCLSVCPHRHFDSSP